NPSPKLLPYMPQLPWGRIIGMPFATNTETFDIRTTALSPKFFERNATVVARELLGTTLVRKARRKIFPARIVEVEAYEGFEDKASHASRGQTLLNGVMFGPAGVWYVYLCYGVHWMLNIVCAPPEHPAGVLIRGVDVDGMRID